MAKKDKQNAAWVRREREAALKRATEKQLAKQRRQNPSVFPPVSGMHSDIEWVRIKPELTLRSYANMQQASKSAMHQAALALSAALRSGSRIGLHGGPIGRAVASIDLDSDLIRVQLTDGHGRIYEIPEEVRPPGRLITRHEYYRAAEAFKLGSDEFPIEFAVMCLMCSQYYYDDKNEMFIIPRANFGDTAIGGHGGIKPNSGDITFVFGGRASIFDLGGISGNRKEDQHGDGGPGSVADSEPTVDARALADAAEAACKKQLERFSSDALPTALVGWKFVNVTDTGGIISRHGSAEWPGYAPLLAECSQCKTPLPDPKNLRSVQIADWVATVGTNANGLSAMERFVETHIVPHPQCNCGIHAATMLEDALRYEGANNALMQVSLAGRMVVNENGYRAQMAYPKMLWLLDKDTYESRKLAARVYLRYGIPVGFVKRGNLNDWAAIEIANKAN